MYTHDLNIAAKKWIIREHFLSFRIQIYIDNFYYVGSRCFPTINIYVNNEFTWENNTVYVMSHQKENYVQYSLDFNIL